MSLDGRGTQRSDAIDGLRAVAALSVFVFHATWRSPTLHDSVSTVTGHLDTGVEMFFVLSGFLIFGPFAKAIVQRSGPPRLGRYATRRVTRVWPAYLAVLTIITIAGQAELDGARGFLKHATLSYLYLDDQGGEGLALAWTLVVETSFYAFVPVAAFVIARSRAPVVGAALALIGVGALAHYHAAYTQDSEPWVRILPPALLTLGVGMLLASVRQQGDAAGAVGAWLRRAAARPGLLLVVAATAFVVVAWVVPASTDIWQRPQERFTKEVLQMVIASCLVLPVLLPGERLGWWPRALGHRVTAYLGTISYGFYLWHIPVLRGFRSLLVSDHLFVATVGLIVSLGCSLALAAASWHLIERPLLDRVGRRRVREPAAPAGAAPARSR